MPAILHFDFETAVCCVLGTWFESGGVRLLSYRGGVATTQRYIVGLVWLGLVEEIELMFKSARTPTK